MTIDDKLHIWDVFYFLFQHEDIVIDKDYKEDT